MREATLKYFFSHVVASYKLHSLGADVFFFFDQKKDVGDMSSRHELRNRLKCNSFRWFMENIYREKYIFDDPKWVKAWGMVRVTVYPKE